ncbi:MAG: hypothetical protein GY716_00390 [bacterium]|nr:hypothetical protein [bacterium]
MLNVMRDNLKHLKWVLWLVAIAMVLSLGLFFDIGGGQGGVAADWAARVNGVEIPSSRLIRAARLLDEQYRSNFGENYEQLRPQLRLGSQTLQRLVQSQIIVTQATELGLEVTKEELANSIRTDPNLQGPDGKFIGEEEYKRRLRAYFRTPDATDYYEQSVREELLIRKWTVMMTQSVRVDDSELEQRHRKRSEKSAIDYVVVKSAEQNISTELGDAEVRAYYDEHTEDYFHPEGRSIRWIVVEREAELAKVQLSDDDVRQAYESNQATYSHPEQRRARHILFSLDPAGSDEDKEGVRVEAQAVLDRIQGGEDFEALARALSADTNSAKKGGDLGFFERGRMVPQFEEAAFATAVGQLAPLTETDFGFHIIEVTEAREAGLTALEEVADNIRQNLRVRRADEAVVSETQRLQGELQTADQLQVVADREGLAIQTRLVTRTDRMFESGVSPDYVNTLFAMQPGDVSAPFRVGRGMAIAVVDEVVQPGVSPFEEVENAVRGDLLNETSRAAALAAAQRQIDSGKSIEAIAKALSSEKQESGDLAPGDIVQGVGGLSPEIEQIFGDSVKVGDRGVIRVPAGALLYEVTTRVPFDPAQFAAAAPALRQELLTERKNQLQLALINRLRLEQDIVINTALVNNLDNAQG